MLRSLAGALKPPNPAAVRDNRDPGSACKKAKDLEEKSGGGKEIQGRVGVRGFGFIRFRV